MRVALVINRSAGSFRRLPVDETIRRAAECFTRAGHLVEVHVCGRRDLAQTLSALPARTDLDCVVVGGGDGTILTAILAGLGIDKPLGLLPLGTLNLLARDLGLPADPVAAAERLAHGHAADIDLAEVNGLPFAIWASLGMHPRIVRRRDKLQRSGLTKWPAFALAALRAFRRRPLMQASFSIDGGETLNVVTPILVISNNSWRDETLPPTRSSLDKGELVVHVAKPTTRAGLLWLAFNALIGRWKVGRLMDTFKAHEVRVTGRKSRMILSLDGEVTALRGPLVFRCRPKALHMLMPDQESPAA